MSVAPILTGLATAVVLLSSGCGDRKKRAAKKPAPEVTVQGLGEAPRTRLRYRFRVGETLHYRMTSHRKISGLPGPSAPVKVRLSALTEQVQGRRARLRWRVEHVSSGSARLRGLSLYVQTTDRGEISTVGRSRPGPKSAVPLGQSVRQLFLAWPAEAVGPGARWTQVRKLLLAPSTKGGIRARVEARYKLERVVPCGQSTCAHLSVSTSVKLSHKAGRVKILGNGSGSGRVVFDLRRGRLLESHTRAEIGMSTSLKPGKIVQRLTLKQSMELTR